MPAPHSPHPPLHWTLGFTTVAILAWSHEPFTSSLVLDLVVVGSVLVLLGLVALSRRSLQGPNPLATYTLQLAGLAFVSALIVHRFPEPWTLSVVFGVLAFATLVPFLLDRLL